MHADNLTSREIKEILVYSASHHGAWQIITTLKVSFDISIVKAQGHGLLLPIFPHSATPQAHQASKKGLTSPLLAKRWHAVAWLACPLLQPGAMQAWEESQNAPCSLSQRMQHPHSVSKGTGSFNPWRGISLPAGQICQRHQMQKQLFAIPSKERCRA